MSTVFALAYTQTSNIDSLPILLTRGMSRNISDVCVLAYTQTNNKDSPSYFAHSWNEWKPLTLIHDVPLLSYT